MFLWVAVACAARMYYAIIVILSTHILVVVWYQLPIHDGRASDEESEKGSHCPGEEGKKDGSQGGREVKSEGGDER